MTNRERIASIYKELFNIVMPEYMLATALNEIAAYYFIQEDVTSNNAKFIRDQILFLRSNGYIQE